MLAPSAIVDQVKALSSGKEQKETLTEYYNMLREDSSKYGLFEQASNLGCDFKSMLTVVTQGSEETADKAAWVLSSIMSHQPRSVGIPSVSDFLGTLSKCSELGRLEAITNLLKFEGYRMDVWLHPSTSHHILSKMDPQTPAPVLYKSIFATWMLSFSPEIVADLKHREANVVKKLKDILVHSRVEKVIRLSMAVLKNFLGHKAMCEDIVNENIMEAVQQLEYEKWRDPELYDDIASVAQKIGYEVNEMSSFERYLQEVKLGVLTWGYLHTSKFFAENITKFESDNFASLTMLAECLQSSDTTTLAVACHDIGEFVSLHPSGKKLVAMKSPEIKEKVMTLMASQDDREVRREALLCCQKLMLNKWQDLAVDKK